MSISAGTLNSVSIASTTATLNITPPAVEAAYSLSQVLYKVKGASAWTTGTTYVGSLGVAGNVNQTGLVADTLYEFMVMMADSSSRYSAPSSVLCAISTASISENNLFVNNAKILLANSATFISWVGGTTSSDALLRIHKRKLSVLNPNQNIYFPCAVVYFEGDSVTRFDTSTTIRNMNIKFQLLQECDGGKDRDEPVIAYDFMATIGKIQDELDQLNGVDSYLNYKSMTVDIEPTFDNLTVIQDDDETNKDLIFTNITLQAGH